MELKTPGKSIPYRLTGAFPFSLHLLPQTRLPHPSPRLPGQTGEGKDISVSQAHSSGRCKSLPGLCGGTLPSSGCASSMPSRGPSSPPGGMLDELSGNAPLPPLPPKRPSRARPTPQGPSAPQASRNIGSHTLSPHFTHTSHRSAQGFLALWEGAAGLLGHQPRRYFCSGATGRGRWPSRARGCWATAVPTPSRLFFGRSQLGRGHQQAGGQRCGVGGRSKPGLAPAPLSCRAGSEMIRPGRPLTAPPHPAFLTDLAPSPTLPPPP